MVTTTPVWALLFILPWALAGPVPSGSSSCSSECRIPLNPKFQYVDGKTYTHSFESNSQTGILGTTDDRVLLTVKGQALVTFRSACDATLQLRQTSVDGLQETVDVSELEKRQLRFTWQDGTIESICAEESDPVWAVNIKRSVLSLLQHSAQFLDVDEKHVVESDVIGRCPTMYDVEGSGKSVKVTKTKIPNQCSHRIGRNSSIPTVEYHVSAETQTIPLLNSTSVCRQDIKEGVIQSTECSESHLLRPFSTEKGGAFTDVTAKIALVSTTDAGAETKLSASSDMRPSTLILDPRGVQSESQSAKDVSKVVRSICESLNADSPAQISQLFTELVYSMRMATPEQIKSAWIDLRSKKTCDSAKAQKLFLDALPQAGSTGSIVLMAQLLKEKQDGKQESKLSSRQALGWYLSMPLSKYSSLEAIQAIVPLVEGAAHSPVALLGLTGMARRYCIQHPEQCENSREIKELSTKLGKLLGGNKCQVDAKDEIRVISALKALGNLGFMSADVRNTVVECAKDQQDKLPETIRLAAIEATRNQPCDKQVKENLMTILEDTKEENEIRIAAYQGVMRCACSHSVLRIETLLASEEHNQVGSYISSHLENIRSNPTPGKQNARRLVKKLNLQKSYPSDLRKYSRNLVAADFCHINNAGWDVDADIVYASKSFLPRSASMNVTLDLFGQSVNVFELGVRAENLENMLESFLGPNAWEKEHPIADLLEKGSESVEKFGENVINRLSSATRSKRASIKSNDLAAFDNMVHMKEKSSGIKLDAFLRVFGSEVGMINYRGDKRGDKRQTEFLAGMEEKIEQAWRDLIRGAKNVNIEVARSLMFLDTSATFPTVAGFPLRLSVNGTTTIGLGLESELDIPALIRDPLNADVKLKVNPLTVTQINAAMTVDIAIVKTGVKMAATMHSSAAADFTAKLQKGSSVDIKLDLPKSKITIVDFTSEVMMIQRNAGKEELRKPVNIANEVSFNRGGCSERTTAITGLRLCARSSVSIPRPKADASEDYVPAFPLSGRGSFAIVLEKSEPSMKGYQLLATLKQEGPKTSSLVMTLDTPGSTTDRKVSVKGTLTTSPKMSVKVDAAAPWGSMDVEAELVNSDDTKSAMLKLVTKEKREYYGKAQLNIATADRKRAYTATVEAGWPEQPRAVLLEGKIAHTVGSSIEVSLKPAGPYASWPLSVQLLASREFSGTTQKISLSGLQLVTPLGRVSVSSEMARQDRSYSASFDMKYGTTEQKINSVQFNAKMDSPAPQADAFSYKTVVTYKSSRFPDMNVDLKWDLQRSTSLLANTIIMIHGRDNEKTTNRLYLSQYSMFKGEWRRRDLVFDNKLEVTYPLYALDAKLDQTFKFDQRALKASLNVEKDKNKLVESDVSFILVPKDTKNIYELSAKLALPGRTILLTDTGKRIDANSFSITPVLEIQPENKKVELNGKASYIRDGSGLSLNLDSELRASGLNSPIKLTHSYQHTGENTITTANKIEWDGKTQLSLNGKVFLRTPNQPAIEMSALWNGRVDAKVDARLSKDESKMDVDLNLIRLQRRVKINSQHKVLGDLRSGSLNVAWDADKDPSKQFGLDGSMSLSVPQRSVDLKSTVNVLSKIYNVNVNGKIGADLMNGEHSIRAELQLPSLKKTSFSVLLANAVQARKINNRVELETMLPAGNTYKLTIVNDVPEVDRNARTWNAVTDVTFKATGLEDMKLKVESKRFVKAEKRGVELKTLVIAPKFGQNIDGSLFVEVGKESFRTSSKYQRGNMLVTLDSNAKLIRQGDKTTVEGSFEVRAPTTSWKNVKLAGVAAYDLTDLRNFDVAEKLSIVYRNTETISVDLKAKRSPSNIDMSVMLDTPFKIARRQGLSLSFESRREGSLVATWTSPSEGKTQEIRIELNEIEMHPNQQLRFKLTTATPFPRFESSELKFDGRRLDGGKLWELDLDLALSEKRAKLTGKLNLSPAQREIDLTLSLPNYTPFRFIGRVEAQAPTYTIETRADWGSAHIEIKGTTKYVSSEDLEVKLMINSPELSINKFELMGSNKKASKERIMEFKIIRQSNDLASIKSVYERSDSRSGIVIKGSAQVKMAEPAMSGSVKYEAEVKHIDSDEKGKEYKMIVDVTAGDLTLNKLNGKLKNTDKERSVILSACTTSGCREGSLLYKAQSSQEHEAHILLKDKESNGSEEVQGLRAKLVKESDKFEHSIEVIFDEAKNRLMGYKAYKRDSEIGLELYTPKRMSAINVEITRGSGRQTKSQYIVNVWMDKIKSPERKLVIATTVEPQRRDDMEGYSASTLIKHPLMPRDLEYKIEFHHGSPASQNLHHLKLDLDVMDSAHKRWTLETHVKNRLVSDERHEISIDSELRSQGTGVSAQLSLRGSASSRRYYSAEAELKFKESERVVKELFARVNATRHSAAIVLGSPAKQMELEGRWNYDRIVSHPRVQFSLASRLFSRPASVFVMDLNTSPHVDIKVFNKAAPEHYHQIVGGLIDDRHFELALVRQVNVQKKDLAAAYVHLNRSDLLSTRLSWSVEDLRALASQARIRSQASAKELTVVVDSLAIELKPILSKWRAFSNLPSGFEKLASDMGKQLKQMRAEAMEDESIKEAREMMENVIESVQRMGEIVRSVTDKVRSEIDWAAIVDTIRVMKQRFVEYLKNINESLIEALEDIIRYLKELREKYTRESEVFRAVRDFIAGKRQELERLIDQVRTKIDSRIRELVQWYESIDVRGVNTYAKLKKAFQDFNMEVIRQRVAHFVEEEVLQPLEERLNEIAKAYPEISRSVYRYVRKPINKVRRFIKENSERRRSQQQSNKFDTNALIKSVIGETNYDMKKGEIRHDIPLFRKVESLRDLWRMLAVRSSSVDMSYSELRSKYSPALVSSRVNGYASLIGSTGFITFDKKAFDLSAGCQYLLARDFLNKDFAVAVNFEQSGQKSVIFTDGSDQVEIKGEQVLVNNKAVPLRKSDEKKLTNIKIERRDETITVRRTRGVVLSCNVEQDICTLELSPFYSGRTMGLWGTFSNEHVDDMTEPSGKVSKDLASFATSWKLNKSCKDNMQAIAEPSRLVSLLENDPSVEVCSSLFDDEDSDYSDCFRSVSPKPYYDLCRKMASKSDKSDKFSSYVKKISAGYVAACERSGVSM